LGNWSGTILTKASGIGIGGGRVIILPRLLGLCVHVR
jgi:hypothetical protein